MTAVTDLLADEDAVFEERRRVLIERADAFCRSTGMSRTAVSLAALNDPAALAEFDNGRKPRLSTFRRVMAWFAVHETAPTDSTSAAREKGHSSKPAVLRSSAGEVEPH